MADFNQSPLGQSALALSIGTPSAGNSIHLASITPDATSYATDGTSNAPAFYTKRSAVSPQWRRESKVIKARE